MLNESLSVMETQRLIQRLNDADRLLSDGDPANFDPVDTDVAELLGITHYVSPEDTNTYGDNEHAPGSKQSKILPRSLKGWMYFLARVLTFGLYDPNGVTGGANEEAPEFRPIYDVEALKNFPNVFQPEEQVVVTEKIHGSNGRFSYVPSSFGGHFYAGSRKLWKKLNSKCVWREAAKQNPWIESWCREHPNYTLYGEVIPTQELKYGCKPGEVRFFVFDVRTPEGEWLNWGSLYSELNNHLVPILYEGPFDMNKILPLVDGPSTIPDAANIREGCVIKPIVERDSGVRGLGRMILKVVSNQYLEKA